MEKTFPGVEVYIACKEEAMRIFKDEHRVLSKKELEQSYGELAYIRELNCNMRDHPVQQFMIESGIPYGPINQKVNTLNKNCLIVSKGQLPTKSLTESQLDLVKNLAKNQGYTVATDGNYKDFGWIIGVESEEIFEAAALGIRTTLIITGFGEKLYQKMYPSGEILRLECK